MALIYKNLEIPFGEQNRHEDIRAHLAHSLGIKPENIDCVQIVKRSLDARKKSKIVFRYQVYFQSNCENHLLTKFSRLLDVAIEKPDFNPLSELKDINLVNIGLNPIVVGCGPCGIFLALILSEAGLTPVILERGECIDKRVSTVRALTQNRLFSEDSNFCFGEGGAGTFSDGKLYHSKANEYVEYVFRRLVEFGAPKEILYDSKPHIGTDYLSLVIKNMRHYLQNNGCTFLFNAKATDIIEHNNKASKLEIKLENGDTLDTNHLVLAIGHSARDTYRLLFQRKLKMEPKGFAVGTRIEHPQELINSIQYGNAKFPRSAEYKLTAQVNKRGLWSFCMCPGGVLLPTNAQKDHLAVNGMSNFSRNSGYANSALVVSIHKEDYFCESPLDGIIFQEEIERRAFQAAGANYNAPAQLVKDFINQRQSKKLIHTTYKPGVEPARIDTLLPSFVSQTISAGLLEFDKKMRGFLSDKGTFVGVETKTSAPLRITRNDNFTATNNTAIYPAGEGAGYAGGIVSSAIDGIKVAQAVLRSLTG